VTIVDASAIIELLAPPDTNRRNFLVDQLPEPATPWLAPDILLFEVFAVVRRYVLRGAIPHTAGERALGRLLRLPIELVPTASLLSAAWPLRDRFSAADSLYAALALRASEPFLTTDLRLANAATDAGIDVRAPS
jgi:predicted nucleic acid-binding protein